MEKLKEEYDYVIVGSGFGGSVSALRLSEKGYSVLVIEKGKWYKNKEDFPKTNWNLKKWLWLPSLKLTGIMKMTIFRHVSVLSGVGVGGGSLTYANTLPIPKEKFYKTGSWAKLNDWQKELKPFFELSHKMLGATENPYTSNSDKVFQELAKDLGKEKTLHKTKVAVYFGEKNVTKEDPYFGGEGPDRTGCILCAECMIGCKHNAKNTLDKNYLYLAQKLGAKIIAEKKVYDVIPLGSENGSEGYEIKFKDSLKTFPKKYKVKAKGVIFSGGVLGTVSLLLDLKKRSLKNLSNQLGKDIRTNSESLILITTRDKDKDFSDGIAIGSILDTDENTHVEPVVYGKGSGIWRLLVTPLSNSSNFFIRVGQLFFDFIRHPINNLKLMFVDDYANRTIVLLFMQTIDGTLRFSKGVLGMKSGLNKGKKPSAFIPQAFSIAKSIAKIMNGKPSQMVVESLSGIPSTAHILGGCCMGETIEEGVIDKYNKVFGYKNMMVCDGSVISANPGVNPSLSITSISEHAMSFVEPKDNLD